MEKLRKPDLKIGLTGDRQVIRNIVLSERLYREGNPKFKNYAINNLLTGGAQKAKFQGGVQEELQHHMDAFTRIYSNSAGAWAALFGLSGNAREGRKIYSEHNPGRVVQPWKVLQLGKVIDIAELMHIAEHEVGFDTEQIHAARPDFFVGVTNKETGRGEFLEAKNQHMLKIVGASSSIPFLAGIQDYGIEISDTEYIDGEIANPLPIKEASEGATDLLVVMNEPPVYRRIGNPRVRQVRDAVARMYLGKDLAASYAEQDARFNEGIDYIHKKKSLPGNPRILVIHPLNDGMALDSLTTDKHRLEKVAYHARRYTENLFDNWYEY